MDFDALQLDHARLSYQQEILDMPIKMARCIFIASFVLASEEFLLHVQLITPKLPKLAAAVAA